jgi:hypothetical protein
MYGDTQERALQVLAAHMKSDRFLRECTNTGQFEGRVTCKSVAIVVPLSMDSL